MLIFRQTPAPGDLVDQGYEGLSVSAPVELLRRPFEYRARSAAGGRCDVPIEERSRVGHTSLKDPLRCRRMDTPETKVVAQEHVEDRTLLLSPHLPSELEGRARCECDEGDRFPSPPDAELSSSGLVIRRLRRVAKLVSSEPVMLSLRMF